jgi:glycosyltransferase involved in cell wall biosynthesis
MNFLFYVPQMASYGGMERHVCLLALLLARNGHRITLLTTSNSLNAGVRSELVAAGIEMRELPVARGEASKAKKLGWLLWNALKLRFRTWDWIYTNGQSGLARFVWLAAGPRTRVVHHHHTAGDPAEQKTWHPAFRRTLETAAQVVACSRSTKAHIESALGRHHVHFLPYLTPEMLPTTAVVERVAQPETPLHFGFVGRLVPTKGIDTLCALSQAPALAGVQWQIHGAGEDYPAALFDAYPNVHYHGPFQGPEECAAILQRLDALALFSRHNEGMPLSLIEAMAAGLPWIATDQGGTREMAVVAENCEVVSATAALDDLLSRTLALAERIRAGKTSRTAQRRVYDAYFTPGIVARHWLTFFGCPQGA